MIFLNIALISIFLSFIMNTFVIKIIGIVDCDILGINTKNKSFLTIYKDVFRNKNIFIRFLILGIIFIVLNYIILSKIFLEFNIISIYNYLKYYYLFVVLYIFAFIDYVTYYVYTILSYPLIIFSLLIFMLSFLNKQNFKNNLETIILISFMYLLIKGFKFLGDGDFDILLIVVFTLGVLPTIFIFYLSIIMSGLTSIIILVHNRFKLKSNKIPFIPFIFIATFIFIIFRI